MSILRKQVIDSYIGKNYPNARIVKHSDPDSGLHFYNAEQLRSVDKPWFPLSATLGQDGKVVYGGRDGIYHTYVEGQTGVGKTTRFVIQSIRALSSLKGKPSFVVTDPYGEIIENLQSHLKANGYRIKILNCDDSSRSDTYNPLAEVAKQCLRDGAISEDCDKRVRRIAEVIQAVQSQKDPNWEIGARAYTYGSILDKLEDLVNGDIPPSCVTLYNVMQNHYWLREELGDSRDLTTVDHYKKKGPKSTAFQKLILVTNSAPVTRAGYYSILEGRYDALGQATMYALSSTNTIDLDQFLQEPTVIVIQSGSTNVGNTLVSLLVNDIYSKVARESKKYRNKQLPRNIHCFLDEFANLHVADKNEFTSMLTTSRKFGMFWHMVLQCDAQLDCKYDALTSRTIRSNCTEVFLGSQDRDTEVRFARTCGQKTIESLGSLLSEDMPNLVTVDLMTPERLHLTPEGELYISSDRHPLLHTYFEAFYNCPEFTPPEDLDRVYPVNRSNYRDTYFTPDDIPARVTPDQLKLLQFLGAGDQSLQAITKEFPGENIKLTLKELAGKSLVKLLDGSMVHRNVTDQAMALLEFRATLPESDAPQPEEKPRKRSAFDWDFEDDGFSGSGSDEIDQWFDAARTEEEVRYDELMRHTGFGNQERIVTSLLPLTCVPEPLMEMIQRLSEEDGCFELLRTENLTDAIIQAFIQGNQYVAKASWNEAFRREVAVIERHELLPRTLVIIFKGAYRRFAREMTDQDLAALLAAKNKAKK